MSDYDLEPSRVTDETILSELRNLAASGELDGRRAELIVLTVIGVFASVISIGGFALDMFDFGDCVKRKMAQGLSLREAIKRCYKERRRRGRDK